MDAATSALCLGMAAVAFSCAWTLVGREGRARAGQDNAVAGVLAGVIGRIEALPMVVRVRRRGEVARRRTVALRQLPTMIDILTLGLSAGLSFDASLDLYCQRYRTELSSALSEAMVRWRLGILSRGEALHALAEEMDLRALRRFADAVSQSLAFGTPLAATLERQAQVIRDEQRGEMEAEIERVPVRMLIPLGTLIVPAMLLAILGPLLAPSIVMT